MVSSPTTRSGIRRFSRWSTRQVRSTAARLLGDAAAARLASSYRLWSSRLGVHPFAQSQSDEGEVLERLLRDLDIPRSFCEFGFHVAQYNCAALLRAGWQALLVDGSGAQVKAARRMIATYPGLTGTAVCAFLTTDNVRATVESRYPPGQLGVLSIDVDGNDYWLLRELLPLRPAVIVCEYNASFGCRPITIPYDPTFRRHEQHPSGIYHGASLTALAGLCDRHGYGLVAVSESGVNAFFVRRDLIRDVPESLPERLYRQNLLRNALHGTDAEQQWAAVRHLPFVAVS